MLEACISKSPRLLFLLICTSGVCNPEIASPNWETQHENTSPQGGTHQTHKPVELLTRPSAVPLDLNTFCSIHVVAFSVRSIILGVGRRSRLKVLCVLCEFHSFGLGPRLVTELYQSHCHGEAEASDKNIENTRNIAQAQSTGLVLRETNHLISFAE